MRLLLTLALVAATAWMAQASPFRVPSVVPTALAYRGNGRRVAETASDRKIRLLRPQSSRPFKVWLTGGVTVVRLAFCNAGNTLLGACSDFRVRAWQVPSGRLTWTSDALPDEIISLSAQPDGQTVAAAC